MIAYAGREVFEGMAMFPKGGEAPGEPFRFPVWQRHVRRGWFSLDAIGPSRRNHPQRVIQWHKIRKERPKRLRSEFHRAILRRLTGGAKAVSLLRLRMRGLQQTVRVKMAF